MSRRQIPERKQPNGKSTVHIVQHSVDGKGERIELLRREIEEIQSSRQSLMPVGLEQQLNPRDLVDLHAFLQQSAQKQTEPLPTTAP